MAKGTFGEHLKREREMRGVSLDEISAATRIGTRLLRALEDEQWDRLPGGVFNRGFVRAVARFLGLDEENLLAEYTLATNDQSAAVAWAAEMTPQAARSRRLPWVLALVAVALAAGGWFAWHRYASARTSHKTASGRPTQAIYKSFKTSQSAAADTTQTPRTLPPLGSAGQSAKIPPTPKTPRKTGGGPD
jgi:cytoskeleton protein RodZ